MRRQRRARTRRGRESLRASGLAALGDPEPGLVAHVHEAVAEARTEDVLELADETIAPRGREGLDVAVAALVGQPVVDREATHPRHRDPRIDLEQAGSGEDRKSTRLNSSHPSISY